MAENNQATILTGLLSYVVAWLVLGYVGFQLGGWTGAILLPIGATVAMALVVAPFAVFLVGAGLIINVVKGCQTIKQRILAEADNND